MTSTSVSNFVAAPDSKNIFEWHFLIFGLKDCPYEGGYYHGKILFPQEYPLKPPGIMMITPNGRFEQKKRICMSISDYHPESWNPIWKTETIITALISFMTSEEYSAGCVNMTASQRRQYAAQSLEWNMNNKTDKFVERFSGLFEKAGINLSKIEESKEEA